MFGKDPIDLCCVGGIFEPGLNFSYTHFKLKRISYQIPTIINVMLYWYVWNLPLTMIRYSINVV